MTKWMAKYNHTKEAQAMVAHSGLLHKIDVSLNINQDDDLVLIRKN